MKRISLPTVVILAICLGVAIQAFSKNTHKAIMAKIMQAPVYVTTETVHPSIWQDKILATGSLSAFFGATLKAETSGRVTKKMFTPGAFVKAGTPLVEIYPDIIKGELKKAEALLALSKVDYILYEKLYRKGFFTKIDLDRSYTLIQSNEGDVEKLKAQLVQTLICAPFDGLLGLDLISLGDYLTPGKEIVNLQSLDPIRVEFYLPETVMSQLSAENTVEMRTPAYPKKIFSGKIYAKESLIDKESRQLACRASIPNQDHLLLHGMFGEVTVYLGDHQSVIIIPQSAIIYSTTETYLYRVINQKAVKTPVTLGRKLENSKIIILNGLKEGDVIVTAGQLKLSDGASINLFPTTQENKK